MSNDTTPEPVRQPVPQDWQHHRLYAGVKEAVSHLPSHFRTETVISGIIATDLFTLGAVLNATIEEQVVNTLNSTRTIWDEEGQYDAYSFVRQSQTFPDVLLRKHGSSEVIVGLELKSWYLLAKEGEPSFRFTVTPAACNPQDLIVIVPWALSNVISGTPRVFAPYVESARFAAQFRNHHWRNIRKSEMDTSIRIATGVGPYPIKSDAISDVPAADTGKNFGRFARTGIMDEYLEEARNSRLCGIAAEHWRAFFAAFQDQKSPDLIKQDIQRLVKRLSVSLSPAESPALDHVQKILTELESLLLG
jgi:hypothetical protein